MVFESAISVIKYKYIPRAVVRLEPNTTHLHDTNSTGCPAGFRTVRRVSDFFLLIAFFSSNFFNVYNISYVYYVY